MFDYRADDRIESDPAVNDITLSGLISLWAERDSRYAQRDQFLREDQIETIRKFRKLEANDLRVGERARGWAKADAWYPPEHGQGRGQAE